MNFIKTSFLSGISTAISLLARLISTKIVAVYLGTNGMFLMGQLKDFLRLGNTIGSFVAAICWHACTSAPSLQHDAFGLAVDFSWSAAS